MEFESSVESVDEVTRKFKVTIPVDHVTKEFEVALGEVVKTASLKGFRPGKAPRDIVEKLHGPRVRMEVANRLIGSSLQKLLKEHKLNMVGNPEIDIASFEPGKEIEYTANISIFPKPEITGYESFDIKVPKREAKEEDVQDILKNIQESKATLSKLQFRDTAQVGDVIEALVSVKVDEGQDVKPEPVVVPLGENRLPKELEEGLVGLKIGEIKEFELVLPEDHREVELRGKKANYKVELQALSERVLPELNDEFVKGLQYGVETLLELRMRIRGQIDDEIKRNSSADLHAAILDQVIARNNFQVPQILVDDEIRGVLARNGALKNSNIKYEEIDVAPFRETFNEMATRRVRSAIIVDRIAEKEKIQVTDEEYRQELSQMAERSGLPQEDLEKYLVKEKMIAGVLMDIQRNKTLDFLAARAKVEYTELEAKKSDS